MCPNTVAANVKALAMCRHSMIRQARTSAESNTKDDIYQLAGIYSVPGTEDDPC
jgi:hypothetical protein